MTTSQELDASKELVAHYLNLQSLNQEIIDSIHINFFSKSVLSEQIDLKNFGTTGLSLSKDQSLKHAELLFGSLVFAGTSLLTGPILALPISVGITSVYHFYVCRSLYAKLNQHQKAISDAVDFYFANHSMFRTLMFAYGLEKLKTKQDLTNKEALSMYLSLFKIYHSALLNIEPIDNIDQSQIVGDNINVLDNATNKLSQKEQLLIISDEKLYDTETLTSFYTVKNSVSEVELLSTISYLEDELDTTFDLVQAEKISNEILPALRSAVEFQGHEA